MGSTDVARDSFFARLRRFVAMAPDRGDAVEKSRALQPTLEGPYAAAVGGTGILRGTTAKRGARMLRNFSENNEWVRSAISRRKHALGTADWQIVRLVDPEAKRDPITGMRDPKAAAPDPKVVKRVQALLREVNPTGESFGSMLSKTVEDILVLDAGCIEKEKSITGDILALWPVDGATIAIDSKWEKTCDPKEPRYLQFQGYRQIGAARNDQLIYMQHNPRTSTPIGWSPVETCVRVIEASLYSEMYDSDSLRQNAPEGILDFGAGISDAELQKIREYYENEIAGTRKLMITGGGIPIPGQSNGRTATYTAFRGDASAAARATYKKWLATVICTCFELDLTAFNLVESVNRANSKTGQEQSDKGLLGLAAMMEDFLTRELVWEIDPEHAFKFKGLVARDELTQAKIDQLYMQIGVTFPNEVRAREGLDPVDWGNVPYNSAGTQTPDPLEEPNDGTEPAQEPNDQKARSRRAKNPFGARAAARS